MIGKKEWFSLRGERGLDMRPRTWQGFLYMLVFLGGALVIPRVLDFWLLTSHTKIAIGLGWMIIGTADIVHIWYSLRKDR
ncbi:hypothetical protein ACFL5K_06140 [Gemmatimonadota bacterium]